MKISFPTLREDKRRAASFCPAVLSLFRCLAPWQLAAFPLPFHLFFLPSFRKGRKEGNCFMLQQGAFPFPSPLSGPNEEANMAIRDLNHLCFVMIRSFTGFELEHGLSPTISDECAGDFRDSPDPFPKDRERGSAPRERRRGNQSYDLTTVMPLPTKQQPSLLPSLYPSLLLRRTDTRTLNRQKRETWTDFLIPLRQHNL